MGMPRVPSPFMEDEEDIQSDSRTIHIATADIPIAPGA